MEWGIRVSALPEKADGSAGNGKQQKVIEGSHQKLSTLGKTLRRFTRDCISVQKLRRRSPASSHIRAKLPSQGAILRHDEVLIHSKGQGSRFGVTMVVRRIARVTPTRSTKRSWAQIFGSCGALAMRW